MDLDFLFVESDDAIRVAELADRDQGGGRQFWDDVDVTSGSREQR